MTAALGGVERGDEPGVVQGGQRVGGPGDLPVVGMDDVGHPRAESGGELDEVVVGRRHPGHEVVLGEPGQVGAGPEHADPADDGVGGRPVVGQREEHDVVVGSGQGLAQPVDVGGDTADGVGRKLPHEHQDPH